MDKIGPLKIARWRNPWWFKVSPIFLGLFQVIMASPDYSIKIQSYGCISFFGRGAKVDNLLFSSIKRIRPKKKTESPKEDLPKNPTNNQPTKQPTNQPKKSNKQANKQAKHMEETFGTALQSLLDLELTYELNLWFKTCGPLFPYLQSTQNWEDHNPNIYCPNKKRENTSEGETALFQQQKSTNNYDNIFRWINKSFSCELLNAGYIYIFGE